MNNVFVERETFETNGKSYFTYFVRGNVRGKDVKACVVPPDLGGYAVLDIVFNGEKSAELVSTPFEMKDDHNKVISGCTYSVPTKTAKSTNVRLSLSVTRTRLFSICF